MLRDLDDRRLARADGRPVVHRRERARKVDGREVGERDEVAADGEVLNDPLSVVLAERGLTREGVRDGRALRVVLDRGSAASLGSGRHGGGDGVPGREADPREIVGVVGVPLIPG